MPQVPRAPSRRRGRPRNPEITERRRAEILDAAALVFARRGYAQTDLQVLADDLGIGKGTVYRYFPTKQELFFAAADRAMQQLAAGIEEATTAVDDPLAKIAAAIRAYLAAFDRHPEWIELFILERAEFRNRTRPTYYVHRDRNIGPWRALIAGLIRRGVVRKVPVQRVLDVLGDLLHGTLFAGLFTGRVGSLARQADGIVDLVFHGLLARRPGAPRPRTGRRRS